MELHVAYNKEKEKQIEANKIASLTPGQQKKEKAKMVRKIAKAIMQRPLEIETLLRKHNIQLPAVYSFKDLQKGVQAGLFEENENFNTDLATIIEGFNLQRTIDPITISAIIGGATSLLGGLFGKKSGKTSQQELDAQMTNAMLDLAKEKEKQKKMLLYAGLGTAALITIITIVVVVSKPKQAAV